ncbi:hypothetical protein GX586_14805, partial [bacterium]|nr:hypothetical protein [bacterium]
RLGARTIEVVNCEFDMTGSVAAARRFHLRNTGLLFVFTSNLVYNANITDHFIANEGNSYVCDVRYNRFFDFTGSNPGIMEASVAGCAGIVANNTAWGCNYLMWYNQTGDMILTNVNNIVENAKIVSGKNWFRSGSATARSFADYTFSGDTPGVTFDTFTVQGPSNLTALSEAQINFKNTNDVSAGDFLKIDITSVAANSDAANTYPELGLPVWAGWAEPVPEPAAVLLVSMFALPAMLRRR